MTHNEDLIWHIHSHVIPAALSLLPGKMDTLPAHAMLLAIGLQESGFRHRIQVPKDFAHGFWQFEKNGGVKEVLENHTTSPIVTPICDLLLYPSTTAAIWTALPCDSILAAVFARSLLYIDSRSMPFENDPDKGWDIYVKRWRPGAPHREPWNDHFSHAWSIIHND